MKRFICLVVALAMVLAVMPVIGFAADGDTIKAVRTAYFNNGTEWKLYDGTTGNDNILAASNGSDGWQAEQSFTDEDGSVTSQTSLSGTGFTTPRNALIAFTIPENFDAENTAKITLGMKIKNVKQVTSGVRLAVYGNSLDGTWSESTGKGAFGDKSGLTCLGLTDAIQTGNQTGETPSGETVTLSSSALLSYVKQMAAEGKKEVTFRIATPLGGIRIYSYNTADAPTLTFTKGTLTTVNVKTVYYDGDKEVKTDTTTVKNIVAGETFNYSGSIAPTVKDSGAVYTYDESKSVLSVAANADGTSEIIIAYTKWDGEGAFDGYELTDEGAWCWFADPRSIAYKNEEGTLDFSIIGYIDVHGNIKATQVNNLTNTVEEVLIRSNIQPDDHNNPTFLVLPDERIIVFYSRHTDEPCFWYRVTKKPGDLTTLGAEKCLNTANNTTYPSPFLMKNDPDNIYLCWRGIEWHPTIAKLSLPDENGDLHFTYGPYQMVRSKGDSANIRPYAKYASNGVDKIYVTYTTGHPDNEQPNWLYLNQINIADMTLEDINGNTLSTIENGPLAVNKKDANQSFVVDMGEGNMRDWVWQTAIGEDGYPVIAMVRISGGKNSHDYYYVKWNGTEWVKTFLTNAGGHFHQTPGYEMCYSGGMAIDPDDTNVIYCSVPVEGVFGKVYEIIKYTMSEDGRSVVSTEQITKDSELNNVRPFIIPNSKGNDIRLMWMHGNYYDWIVRNNRNGRAYDTAVHTQVELPMEEVSIDNPIFEETFETDGGAYKASTEVTGSFDVTCEKSFTVSADVYMKGAGSVLDMGSIKFGVKDMATQYGAVKVGVRKRAVTTVNGEKFVSSNVYGTSDWWFDNSNGTNGDYGVYDYKGYVNLTFVYDGQNLKVYRDALLDQNIEAEGLTIDGIKLASFEGYVENIAVYDRALNFREVQALEAAEYEVKEIEPQAGKSVTIKYQTADGKQIIPDEVRALPQAADKFTFKEPARLFIDNNLYKLNTKLTNPVCDITGENPTITAVYDEYINIVKDGTFEDENGNFSWGTWKSPERNEYFKDICSDWFFVVNRDTNANVLYGQSIEADDYALGTRWNDKEKGLCSMANFIPVEAGKKYYVSYDYKHKFDGTDAGYMRTTFQPTDAITTDDASDNNIPMSVTTEWQTNEFEITAPADGYIYFHFSYVGSGGGANPNDNQGNGPFWYLDNFVVSELDAKDIKLVATEAVDGKTKVTLKNDTGEAVTGVKVYASLNNADGITEKVVSATIDMAIGEKKSVTLDISGDVKVFVWDKDMKPLTK